MSATNLPDWLEYVFGGGVASSIAALLGVHFARRSQNAIAESNEASAKKTKIELLDLTSKHSADFEGALNDRAISVIDALSRHIEELREETASLRAEVSSLRQALDATTRELHEERAFRKQWATPDPDRRIAPL